jgi:hypothetical protein
MAKRDGWENINVSVPDFAHEHFEKLRQDYGDLHGHSPSQPLVVAALGWVADPGSLEAALKSYREACRERGNKHGF